MLRHSAIILTAFVGVQRRTPQAKASHKVVPGREEERISSLGVCGGHATEWRKTSRETGEKTHNRSGRCLHGGEALRCLRLAEQDMRQNRHHGHSYSLRKQQQSLAHAKQELQSKQIHFPNSSKRVPAGRHLQVAKTIGVPLGGASRVSAQPTNSAESRRLKKWPAYLQDAGRESPHVLQNNPQNTRTEQRTDRQSNKAESNHLQACPYIQTPHARRGLRFPWLPFLKFVFVCLDPPVPGRREVAPTHQRGKAHARQQQTHGVHSRPPQSALRGRRNLTSPSTFPLSPGTKAVPEATE
ncbi:hypothetical protein cyc_06525 [Cyclospora cayetanensis]|uniref:Uncharacterized protein n=1 Tax=Cyclospora cayetanensis TaxID=88456 RepID=A0A1D3D516_9EIME|nr:hypothetical protein cyc_06525 [Cyclospora cayetanensis]